MTAAALRRDLGRPLGARLGSAMQSVAAAQEGRLLLWMPLALIIGVWIYFALPVEPTMAACLALGACAALMANRRSAAAVLVAAVLCGFLLVKLRAMDAAAPMIRATTAELAITGTIESVDKARGKRLALTLAPKVIEGFPPDAVPRRLRLTMLQQQGQLQSGDRVALKARLAPLPTPVQPGGFDPGRRLWFDGYGGVGRVTAAVDVLGRDTGLGFAFARLMTSVRQAIATRIDAHLDGATASIAEALITGERAEIPRAANRSLQASGLFHVLSISGLHMWLVAGSVFWTLRAALALSPTLALRYPIKKWAAAVALCCALFYLLLADSGVATMRSFIMIGVVFFAMLVDRPAVSMRNLAIAALIVLLLQPEAAVDAGFQMSFLAVLGLVTFHDVWSRRRTAHDEAVRAWPWRLVRHAAAAVMLALVTTAIAGTMSSIPASYHFGRLAPYSLVANGLAFPVIGLVVMPMALVATLLMPLGLEALPLLAMGQGLQLVLAISDLVADLPHAQMTVPQSPAVAAIVLALGCAAFCLLAGPVRMVGLGMAGLGLLLALAGRPLPDLLVDGTAGNAALRNGEGLLVPAVTRKSRFSVERWLQSDGDNASPGEAAKRIGWTCLAARCEAIVKGRRIAYVTGDGTAPIACAGFDIMIASFPLRGACRTVPIRIDRFNVWRSGPHALYIDGRDVRILTARGLQGDRPWRIIPLARARPFE